MKKLIRLLCLLSISLSFATHAKADLPPDMKIIGARPDVFQVRGVNDSGQVLVNLGDGTSAIWSNGSFSAPLLPPVGAIAYSAVTMSKQGTKIGGEATFEKTPGGTRYYRGVVWSGPGAGTALDALNTDPQSGSSIVTAVSPNGSQIAGNSTYCRPENPGGPCSGPVPVFGQPFSLIGPLPGVYDSGYTSTINDAGMVAGHFDFPFPGYQGGVLFSGASIVELGFNPRRILNNGNIVGGRYGSGGAVLRTPDGTVTNLTGCGSDVWDGNEQGDILTYVIGATKSQAIWHEGQCYKLADVLPDGFEGYKFPSLNPGPAINSEGQIATMAVIPGGSTSSNADYRAVLLTPKYPIAIQVISTPTGTPGEFEFEAQILRGSPSPAVVWDFGDGSAPQAMGLKVKKKYTKPGTYTAKATVTDSNGSGLKASSTKVIVVPAPTLVLGILIPGYDNNEIPLGANPAIEIHVSALNDGVGELRNLAFQGGTFTASNSDVLSYTTASTSPFSLMPGTGNVYPTNVLASQIGEVRLESLIIGDDELGTPVSANDSRTVSVLDADSILGVNIGAADKSGKVPVTLTNGTGSEVNGRMRFIKPAKKSAALQALILEAKNKKKKKNKKDKTVSYSKYVNYSVGGNSEKTFKVKLSNPALATVNNGKSVKASLVLENTAANTDNSTRTINATLKKSKGGKKKR